MTKNEALKQVKLYVDGWKANDVTKILETLASDCEIIESHGPIYQGIYKVKEWVKIWIQSGGQVNTWNITSFYFVDDVTTFEWTFDCFVNKKAYHIEGVSIARFNKNKISYLREYRMTKPSFKWNEKQIVD